MTCMEILRVVSGELETPAVSSVTIGIEKSYAWEQDSIE